MRTDVPHDLQHEFDRGTAAEENCACGHTHRKHSPVTLTTGETALRCNGHDMSGGLSGMIQWCGCTAYQPYSEWASERGLHLCTGVRGCQVVVDNPGGLCRICRALADDAARDAAAELQP